MGRMAQEAGVKNSGATISEELLSEIVRRIVEVAEPDWIILFGSAARGRMDPDSDVDLLVIKSGVEHRPRRFTFTCSVSAFPSMLLS